VSEEDAELILAENASARIDGLRASLAVLAVFVVVALYFTRLVPTTPVGAAREAEGTVAPSPS
jgi:hypothetical protein